MLLLDTTVFVDLLRRNPLALEYMASLKDEALFSALTLTELMAGARNAVAQRQVRALKDVYDILPLDIEIAEQGGEYLCRYGPSHGTGVIDALLAATAHKHDLTFVTHNRKHFPMLKDVIVPY